MKENMNNNKNMKNAYIENIILWMFMFVGFATMFFFVIDYAKVVRIQDNMHAISDYASRSISINGTTDLAQVATELNNIKVAAIQTITAGSFNCNSVIEVPPTYRVVVTTQSTNNTYEFINSKITSTRAVFNENNTATVTCTLNVTITN